MSTTTASTWKQPRKPKEGGRPPTCKAIIVADNAIIEQEAGKVSIYGIFSEFGVRNFPGFTREARAYVQLSDGIGRYEITVEIHDLQENTVIAKASGIVVDYAQRLERRELIIPIPPLKLSHPGQYDVVVLAADMEIGRQQFVARRIER